MLWRGFDESAFSDVISIPKLVEAGAEELRARYLAWIYELGEMPISGKRVVDHLEFRIGLSYWWMTLFAEKCNFDKSPQIDDAIRLMAFEDWATGRSLGRVVLDSCNAPLAECMRSWCAGSGIGFERQITVAEKERRSSLKRLYQSMPHPVQALAWLVGHLVRFWPLRNLGVREWRQTKGRVTFISYLFNLVPGSAKEGRFESRYWAHLPDELQREGCKTNWLHLYVEDALLHTPEKAADVIRQFNTTGRDGQTHVTLDAFLSAKVVFRTLRDWFRLAWIGGRLRRAIASPHAAALNLWPLFQDDWQRTMSGQTALSGLLNYNLFESALKALPKQRVGVYLQENQGWEFALIHAWRTAGHGRLIGSPHSTVRYWDLRYFFDPRSYSQKGRNNMLLPDQVAMNGPAARDAYVTSGYPVGDLVDVEALRYLYLVDIKADADIVLARPTGSPLRVLVLGEYLLSSTEKQMRLLEKAAGFLPKDMKITVKPHPNCPVQVADYPGLRLEVTMSPISTLVQACDVAYTGSITSAAVDAFCAGVPVVSVLDPDILNLSPLRGQAGVLFASTPEELAHAMIASVSGRRATKGQDFFTLDPNLPRWRKLLLESIE
ncbi:MAG: hypothetical protein IH604_07530 [Burkholderiales bacterium]|nr:hypothetical protein [Burkholderiales bacterium]